MDHANHARLPANELTPDMLQGADVYGPGDEKIGAVERLQGGLAVIEVGGFLGLGATRVVMDASNLEFMRDKNGDVHGMTSLTKDELESLPKYAGGDAAEPSGNAGTTDQKPRWEGPPENRPRGYLPAKDDPGEDRDAAGENLRDPDRRDLGDAFKMKSR